MLSSAIQMFDEVIATLRNAAQAKETSVMDRFFTANSFCRVEAIDTKFEDGFLWSCQQDTVYVQYRSYDPSQAFSIQPDINIYLVKLISDGKILKDQEVRFSD